MYFYCYYHWVEGQVHDRRAISGEPTNLRTCTPTHCFLRCLIKPNFSASRTAVESVQNNARSTWARNDTVDWLELPFPISKFCVRISILNLSRVTDVESFMATGRIIGLNAAGSWINWQSFGWLNYCPYFMEPDGTSPFTWRTSVGPYPDADEYG